jgi:hypothetical protein
MKQSRWWSITAGCVLALSVPASQAFELRFGANDAEGHVIGALVNVAPLNIKATDTVVRADGVSWRQFTGQVEGLFGWVFDIRDGPTLVWSTQSPQDLVVDNYLYPNGGSRTVLHMQGTTWLSEVQREVGTLDMTYSCACADLFLAEGGFTEQAFERRDGNFGVATIESQVWMWQPESPNGGEWRVTARQALAFGVPVPEPSVWAMGIAGLALVMRARLRKGARLP